MADTANLHELRELYSIFFIRRSCYHQSDNALPLGLKLSEAISGKQELVSAGMVNFQLIFAESNDMVHEA